MMGLDQRDVKCKYCGKHFATSHPTKIFCSPECSYKYWGQKQNTVFANCKQCGKKFEVSSKHHSYCSENCSIIYSRWAEKNKRRRKNGQPLLPHPMAEQDFKLPRSIPDVNTMSADQMLHYRDIQKQDTLQRMKLQNKRKL